MNEQTRVPDPTSKCAHCAHYFALLGDRDAQIRLLETKLKAERGATEELTRVQQLLDEAGAPGNESQHQHTRLTTAGRLMRFLEAK